MSKNVFMLNKLHPILKFFIILLTTKLTSIKIRCPFLLIIKDIEQENEGELKNKK